MHVMHLNLMNTTPKIKKRGGGDAPGATVLDPPLPVHNRFVEMRYHYTLNCEDAPFSALIVI